MNKLEEILTNKFPDKKIIKLKDLTAKITGISKVRYGNNCIDDNYDEISLNYIDEYGIIYIPDNYKSSKPGNPTAIKNQQLQKNDLIILHRGKIGKVGIVGSDYRRRIVGNNSMIRMQFLSHRQNDTPWFVMQYLQLDYVKAYINTYIPSSGSSSRKILNPEVLSNLPIPYFEECNGQYRNLLLQRKDLLIQTKYFQKEIDALMTSYKNSLDESIPSMLNKSASIETKISEDKKKKIMIDNLISQLQNLSKLQF